MALTDSKTGFRLPWSTDRSASPEAPAEPAETVALEPAVDDMPEATTTTQDALVDAAPNDQEGPVTTLAPDMAATPVRVETPPDPWAPTQPAGAPADEAYRPEPAASAPEPARRPTKFLADLTRAMQAAAEQARSSTIAQFHADGTAVIEEIHARTATTADQLRRRADEDVSSIKDWSKAEIARIREETEQRIAGRREQLEGQLERHAAMVEHEIEIVRGRIASFEEEMGHFFDDLNGLDDPAQFAARAASLPEPPAFAPPDEDALAAILAEPGLGVPGIEAEAVVETVPDVEAGAVSPPELQVEAVVEAEAAVEPDLQVEAVAEAVAEAEPFDREAAMAAIQAAAEAAAAAEADDAIAEPAEAIADPAEAAADEAEAIVAETEPATTAAVEELASSSETGPEPELDPRLAMLGLTPDFAAAEAAAAEAAAAEVEEIPDLGGDLLAARLSGLVPDEAPQEPVASVSTQVVTTGLVSVASIASFKRHLGRLAGVAHVGVSSGPDGEFVFAVEHDPASSLRDLIPTVPGFGARVVSGNDGVLQVSAQDPQD